MLCGNEDVVDIEFAAKFLLRETTGHNPSSLAHEAVALTLVLLLKSLTVS